MASQKRRCGGFDRGELFLGSLGALSMGSKGCILAMAFDVHMLSTALSPRVNCIIMHIWTKSQGIIESSSYRTTSPKHIIASSHVATICPTPLGRATSIRSTPQCNQKHGESIKQSCLEPSARFQNPWQAVEM